MVEDIIMFQVVHRVSGALQRFREGMKTLGVLDAIRMHPDAFRLLFCHEPSTLTAAFWRDYLLDVEEQEGPLQLGGILAFATGANSIPPLGFSPRPSVDFLHELPLRQGRHLPTVNTCINCLRLPVLKKFEDFNETMDFAFGQE
ncbi:G2/M phase-specific E3 ubiquitin-protein ligase-like [Sander lucioperca]|uniref:G2/M phase-specific E3 ubiquitin-protein ligase-like n=1 Tax=Sander lucioperca TaxID=283035 RepID=UPI00125DCB8E|nr:G2/M phase-specific E3 ubiquitin-protein ligase-like [Sander lucioperca]